jgi:hypothetical protein
MFSQFGSKAVDATVTGSNWATSENVSNGWIIADDLGSYFPGSTFSDSSTQSGSILLVPAVTSIHHLDQVEVDGIYNANANTLQVTSVKNNGRSPLL